MADTTNLNDLPETVTMSVNTISQPTLPLPPPPPNMQPPTNTQAPPGSSLDPNVINQLVSGLQQASASGATRLRSVDIPMDPIPLSADPAVQQHHIPHHPQFQGQHPHHNQVPFQQHAQDYPNYIQEDDNMDDIITRNTKKTIYANQVEMWMDELQAPFMVAILFFLFQLPIVKKLLHQNLPFLYYLDGNMNMNGYIILSFFFSVIYYVLYKILI
jgi:hypothetical protein